ncbi:MAG TPA: hypothetical protein VMT75_08470 [Candidatus Saccharimonadales bacterium]|nr:hypothetical protein [Candidatus Saccharimonadales bacterium]
MKAAAVGFRPHSGWTAMVAVSLERGEPVVLLRERVHLVKTFSYTYRQPYHTAAKAPLEEGRAFIAQVRREAQQLAGGALRRTKTKLAAADYQMTHCGLLLGSGRALPALEKILAAHPLIHTADGELFREALARACTRCSLQLLCTKEKELVSETAESLRVKETALLRRVTELGKPLGAPWSQDEKYATLVAWLALSDSAS